MALFGGAGKPLPSRDPRRLEKTPDAADPLPQAGEGKKEISERVKFLGQPFRSNEVCNGSF
jgi:hypothetical protein